MYNFALRVYHHELYSNVDFDMYLNTHLDYKGSLFLLFNVIIKILSSFLQAKTLCSFRMRILVGLLYFMFMNIRPVILHWWVVYVVKCASCYAAVMVGWRGGGGRVQKRIGPGGGATGVETLPPPPPPGSVCAGGRGRVRLPSHITDSCVAANY